MRRGKASGQGAHHFVRALAALVVLGLAMSVMPVAGAQQNTGPATASAAAGTGANAATAFPLPWSLPTPAYRVGVQADGLYAISYADLTAANLPVDTLDPRSFRMYMMGQEIPIRVTGEADGHFDAGDTVLFYGRNVDSLFYDGIYPTDKYTGTNVYWLTYGCAAGPCLGPYGLRMSEQDGTSFPEGAGNVPDPYPHREHLGKSSYYFTDYPIKQNPADPLIYVDHWYDNWLSLTQTRSYLFSANNLPTTSADAKLEVNLLGYASSTTHYLRVTVNNNLVLNGSPTWTDFNTYDATVPVPRSYLVEGTNRIRVSITSEAGAASDSAYVNWVDITYPDTYTAESGSLAFRNNAAGSWQYDLKNFTNAVVDLYNVTDPLNPQYVTNAAVTGAGPYTVSFGAAATAAQQYLAVQPSAWKKPASLDSVSWTGTTSEPADLLDSGNGADYIIVAHRSFWDQAKQLAVFRSQDFRVALVDVQHIYDQFNGGMMSAESIRDFLAYTRDHWTAPAPAYVLLFGDGTDDMRKYASTANTYIPPFLGLFDPTMGETASDNRFVAFGADNVPSMHIGRFPVNNTTQAQAMVDKAINYERGCTCNGAWEKNTLFVSDDLEGGGGDFYDYSNMVADGYADPPQNTIKFVPPTYNVTKEYLGQTCDVVGNPSDAAECRKAITTTLNTTGALVVSFVGHATKETWAVEQVFNRAAVSTLTNGPCLPIILAMTCYEGSFHDYETPETLAEASVRRTGSGSVASFSPTGFGLASGHDYLEKGIFLAWFHNGIDRLGASITYAKQYLVDNSNGAYLDLLDTFVLLGDPGLRVKVGDACNTPTGVLATSFAARQDSGGVRLAWQTADESDMVGFNVLRRQGSAGPFAPVNNQLILADHPGTSAGGVYSYLDPTPHVGLTYQYKLQIVNRDGSTSEYGSAETYLTGLRFFLPFVPKQ